MELGERGYLISIGSGILSNIGSLFELERRVFILTDSGVPRQYAEAVASASGEARIYTVPTGESSKSLSVLESVLLEMMNFEMGRGDALVAVGGGVVGDLGGFAASVYMRGIDFYNVPTTLLSQVDSSIGGKTAVNLGNVKNIAGAFYQPKAVLIDTDTLKTLSDRQISNGLAEVVKMAAASDKELFEALEEDGFGEDNKTEIILSALKIKKQVVERDERETGLRKILNFGHTLGHGIEALGGLFHGECVALGMLPLCGEKKRLASLLEKLGLPVKHKYDTDKALGFAVHDKKCQGGTLSLITVPKIGSCKIEKMQISDFEKLIKEAL